jgi:hypothetical protein
MVRGDARRARARPDDVMRVVRAQAERDEEQRDQDRNACESARPAPHAAHRGSAGISGRTLCQRRRGDCTPIEHGGIQA